MVTCAEPAVSGGFDPVWGKGKLGKFNERPSVYLQLPPAGSNVLRQK